jgi:hypothetical protein
LAEREEITREASPLQTTAATGSQVNGTSGQLKSVEMKIPAGTSVEIETAFDISSAYVEEGDAISFRAVGPVRVNGVTVIAASALATALVVKAKKRGHWGRSGRLAWSMRDIVAVDGQRIPLRFERVATGEGKGGEVATKTGSLKNKNRHYVSETELSEILIWKPVLVLKVILYSPSQFTNMNPS